MYKTAISLLLILITALPVLSEPIVSHARQNDGVLFTMSTGARLKVVACSNNIFRIVYTVKPEIPDAKSHVVVKSSWDPVSFDVKEDGDLITISTSELKAAVAKSDGTISYYNATGALIAKETAPKSLTATSVAGKTVYTGSFQLNSTSTEGLYGIGQLQNHVLNLRGRTVNLVQENRKDVSPVVLSTRGFGILWNNYSSGTFSPPIKFQCKWALNDAIDYYFMYGPEFDRIIAAYRTITGTAPKWPKWAFGFWQCRNRYSSQAELLSIVKKYRDQGLPIDNIVQDWKYYPNGMNGSHHFDPSRYPDPVGMIDTLHTQYNCHFTISVWPSFTQSAANQHYNIMKSKGYLLGINDYLGETYDATNEQAGLQYWKFIEDSLVKKGVDGFWPDATEPEAKGWSSVSTSVGPSASVECIYPLLHSKHIYDLLMDIIADMELDHEESSNRPKDFFEDTE